ncbi:hypothetical protein RhiirB3_453903, partial [Rhizophagus irregularis]
PSVINPDIPPPPLPGPTFTTRSLSLSSDNSGGASAKHSHSVPNNAIDIETTSTHTPGFSPNPTASTGFPVNKVAIITQPPVTNDNSLDSSIHAQTLLTPTTVASQDDKGKYVAFAIPERQPSPDGSAAAIKSAPSRYHAAAYLHDAPDVFKVKFTTNHSMCDEVDCSLSRYSSYSVRARCDRSGDNKKILVFFNNQEDFTDCVISPRADLLDLAFTHYFPADAKLSDEAKSLFVTDIPLFLNEMQVCQAFSRYGTVIKCKLTPKKHYYNGHIQFFSADVIIQFNDIWAIICLEADLLEIATQVNAKALNVPLSVNSYKPKPYVYLNFSSFDTLEAAKELSVAFRDKGLIWHLSNEAHTLCHVCGRSGCSPSVYSPCSTRKVDDHLNKLYSRFNASPRHSRQDSHQSRDKSNSRSRSRSNSRSRNNPSSSRSNNNNNNINTPCPDIFNRNNRTNNNNTNSRVNVNSSGSTQSPHMPHPNSSTSTSQKLESMMSYNYPNNADLHSSPVNTELYSQDVGWDNEPSYNTSSRSDLPPYTSSSLMDISPDASFSALDPNSVLSNRHVPLPSS